MSPLIPWNAGGAYVISALGLGVATGNIENLLYIPLAFACWLAPVIGVFYAVTGLFSPKASEEEIKQWHDSNEPIAKFNKDGSPMSDDDEAVDDIKDMGPDGKPVQDSL
jgi:NhaC family Na+:H+ antiporter